MTAHRIARIRAELRRLQLDALVISSLPHIRYVTSFSGSNALCIIRPREAHFITDVRYLLQSDREVSGFRRTVTAVGLMEGAAQKGALAGCRRVGFESRYLSYAQYRTLRRLFPGITFAPTSELVEDIAVVKDRVEVALVGRAVHISDRAFHDTLKVIRPGVRELEIAAEISYFQRSYGADHDAFDVLVASGKRGSLPHAHASKKRIRSGELVTLDFGCVVNGYHSDMTRTVAVGNVSRPAREMFAVVLEAQLSAIDALKPGMLGSQIDAVARKHIRSSGYGRYFPHGLGHGLGLRLHERPRLSPLSREPLLPGSIVTVEPGVYIPEVGGVRIEDDVLVTTAGCRVLTKSRKDLIIV